MTKEQVFEILDKAIKGISENFCEENCDDVLKDQLSAANLPFVYSVASGISKAVLLIKDASFVIKLPYLCFFNEDALESAEYEWREHYDYLLEQAIAKKMAQTGDPNTLLTDEEKQLALAELQREPDYGDEEFYYELEGATFCDLEELKNGPDWNYCNLECAIYKEAVKRGLGNYFAEEGLLGELHCGHPVYYQQRCLPLEFRDDIRYDSEEYTKRSNYARNTCDKLDIYCFNPIWVADFIDMYGEQELAALNAFLNDMGISDLRESNIGYLDGAPILFDYSGFRFWD